MSVFNGEKFLQEAVESILQQTFRDFEFIIIDDGSTDTSGSILDSYQKSDVRVRVYHQENKGLVDSLNRAWKLARGKYIARMDADDVSMPDRLTRQISFMDTHPLVAVAGGAIQLIDARGKTVRRLMKFPSTDSQIKELLRYDCALCHPTVLLRKSALVALQGYRKVVIDAEDYDLWLRIADRFHLANLDSVVLKYRLHSCQISVRKCRQEGLSGLAARAAASARRGGALDPLASVEEITPATLVRLGVNEAMQQAEIARQYLRCIRNMYSASEYATARSAVESLEGPLLQYGENWVIADFHLWAARLYFHERKFASSILSAGHALVRRPILLGRPLMASVAWASGLSRGPIKSLSRRTARFLRGQTF
jgi:Glycosyl transferase family 2